MQFAVGVHSALTVCRSTDEEVSFVPWQIVRDARIAGRRSARGWPPALIAVVLLTSLASSSATADQPTRIGDWRQDRFSPAHTGLNPDETILNTTNVSKLQSAWTFDTGDTVPGTPVVAGGTLYLESNNGYLYAVDAEDGSLKWGSGSGGNFGEASPAYGAGLLIVGGDQNVTAFDASTGAVAWTAPIGYFTDGGQAIAGGVVYTGDCIGTMHALDLKTGAELWSKTGLSSCIETTPAVADGRVFLGASNTNGGRVFALDASSGHLLWRFKTQVGIAQSAPSVVRGTVYIGSLDGHLYALDAATGRVVWKDRLGGATHSSPGVAHGLVYIGDESGYLYAFHRRDGSLAWRTQVGQYVSDSSPAIANGVVYIAASDGGGGSLLALDAVTGQILFTTRLLTGEDGVNSPIVLNGMVFIGSQDSGIHAFGLGPRP
jgi:outer membrane protein assembly factor BamB